MAGPLKLEVMQGLLAVLLLLCTQRPVLSIPITGTAFPFETCKVSQLRGRYQTYLSRYFKLPEDEGWTFCLTTQVSAYARVPQAALSILSFPLYSALLPALLPTLHLTHEASYGVECHFNEQVVPCFCCRCCRVISVTSMLMTSLALGMSNPSQAEGVELCFSLRPPCPSLPEFAFDGQVLEYSMYDV
ncbi:hypothetical protein QJQ45_028559 [Haematococcus lacustris]|nr:hypothetical protein QJQ45_028559 [Haematococcus lacustris]